MTRISVVIPTYNHARFIGRAMNSVRIQAMDDTEILVVDDGSTDDTYEQIRTINHPVTYIRTTNRGPAAARNLGAQESTGRLILFLDADDALLDGALDAIRVHEERWPSTDLFCGGYLSVNQHGRKKRRTLPRIGLNRERNFTAFIGGKLELQIGASAFRRQLFQHIRFPENLRNGEDLVFFAKVLARHAARPINSHLVAKFDHEDRLRNNTARIVSDGMSVVESLFNSSELPAEFQKYRRMFAARQLLTLSRTHYLRREYAQAVSRYHEAVSLRPRSALHWTYLRKYARSLLRSWAKQRPCSNESMVYENSPAFSGWNSRQSSDRQTSNVT